VVLLLVRLVPMHDKIDLCGWPKDNVIIETCFISEGSNSGTLSNIIEQEMSSNFPAHFLDCFLIVDYEHESCARTRV